MRVKWHDKMSSQRNLNGGGPQGGTLGIWEYLSQTNKNLHFVQEDLQSKFVDDASALEVINLLSIGLASHNFKIHVHSKIPIHNQIIPKENLKSQEYLEKLNKWSKNQKMELNLEKTKVMLFNFSKNYQFTTALSIEDKQIEVVDQIKLLGTTITSDLKWDANVSDLVKRANSRMILLRKLKNYNPRIEDMKIIYTSYIRSILEQSCQVWHFSLTQDNINDLERVQKNALRIILGFKYNKYEEALERLNLENLYSRREKLCIKFAQKCTSNVKTQKMFPKNEVIQKTKNTEQYKVNFARTTRYMKSSIPQMQRCLNKQ